jgi:uncharacterized protein (DUF433 family)
VERPAGAGRRSSIECEIINDRITINPAVLVGKPVIKGTRLAGDVAVLPREGS